MANVFRFHLVDQSGRPLKDPLIKAVDLLTPRITKKFSSVCDPAELSTCVEEAARRAAVYEEDNGTPSNLAGLLWKTISNQVVSRIRSKSRTVYVEDSEAAIITREALEGSPQAIEARVEARELLDKMSERDREICNLEYQGYSAEEIGRALGLTTAAVWKIQSRRRDSLNRKNALR